MKPKTPRHDNQDDLFRSRLDHILNWKHPLFVLADQIDWSVFDSKFGSLYSENKGRPGKPRESSSLAGRETIGAFQICCSRTQESGKVVFDSIRRFKGLERPVIILVELEDVLGHEDLLYVGITRANAHLVVVGDERVLEALR